MRPRQGEALHSHRPLLRNDMGPNDVCSGDVGLRPAILASHNPAIARAIKQMIKLKFLFQAY